MDKLLNPDLGLLITTIVTFLLLVTVLSKVAWKPIIEGINNRENKIREDLERAEKSQKDAEALRQQYETQLADAQKSVQDLVSKARAEAEQARNKMVADAKEESVRILEKGKKDLENQAEQLKEELRGEVAQLTMTVTEKVLQKSADKKLVDEVIQQSLQDLKGAKK